MSGINFWMRSSDPLRALAATARIANIPSVAGNVWLGIAAGGPRGGGRDGPTFVRTGGRPRTGGGVPLSGGQFPQRLGGPGLGCGPSPRAGATAGRCFRRVSICQLRWPAGCWAGARRRRPPPVPGVALMIGLCIGLYTRVHKHAAWAVIPMGLCRALLPVLGFAGFAPAAGEFPATTAGRWRAWRPVPAGCSAMLPDCP